MDEQTLEYVKARSSRTCTAYIADEDAVYDETYEIDLSENKIIITELKSRGIELINLTLGNPYLIPHFNRPCINAPEDGRIGMERIYSVTKEISQAFPEIKFIMSGLSFEGENALDYAAEAIENGVVEGKEYLDSMKKYRSTYGVE